MIVNQIQFRKQFTGARALLKPNAIVFPKCELAPIISNPSHTTPLSKSRGGKSPLLPLGISISTKGGSILMEQLSLNFNVHTSENNYQSRKHLEENRSKFSAQCQQVYALLQSGIRLTVLSAITQYGISSLPRRVLDLKQEDIEIRDCWIEIEGKRSHKEWFMGEKGTA